MVGRSKALGLVCLVAMVGAGCAPQDDSASVDRQSGALAAGDPGDLDILFMIDNSSSMTSMQAKLVAQDPAFMTVLKNFPNGLPNIHVAVVSSDLGAPGDSTSSIGCTPTGQGGVFQSAPQGSCTSTTLPSGAKFISNVGGSANYTGKLEDVFSCVAQLGSNGCGFEHQLAAVARALGADGAPPPAENAGFLRPNAELAIVLLTNEDDCSAPSNTTLYSLNGGTQDISNPLGPIANYRCNQFGHLCKDPASSAPDAFISPPLNPPADAMGTGAAPTLNLTECKSNDTSTGKLTSVASLVAGIRALKSNPDSQIVVGAIAPPVTPYTVAWVAPSSPPPGAAGQLWPQLDHSCGALGGDGVNPLATQHTTDGSFGDPGVRIAQWVHGFGDNGLVVSICDADYGLGFQMIASKIQAHLQPSVNAGAGGAGGNSGVAGTTGGGGAAGGHAGSTGAAGATGMAGSSGTAGATGTAGAMGQAGISGSAGTVGTAGTSGTAGQTGAAGSSGAAGHGSAGSTGAAGAIGAGGHGGAGGAATGLAGSSGVGTAGSSGSATGGAGGATGVGGQAGSATSVGAGGSGGHAAAGGHAGGTGGSGGASNATSDGCSCDTAASSPSGWGFTLLLGALGLTVTRRRRTRPGR